MKPGKVRIGVIGVGHLGEYHVQKYRALPDVELVGIVDTRPERAEEIGSRYDTPVFSDFRELLDHVQGVSLVVPTESHFDLACEVLSRGVHLLVEKPITYELDHADILIHKAKEKRLVLQVGHIERFNPAVVEMETHLTEPVFIESHRMNIFTPRGTDVDVVLDLMIHDLDIILHVVDSEIRQMHAVGMSVVTGLTDIANVRIVFDNGTAANLTASRVSNRTLRKIRVFQPDAYLAVDCVKRELDVTRLASEGRPPDSLPQLTSNTKRFPDSDPLADQISAFVEAVSEGSEPVVSGRDGRRALAVALGIMDQIKRGCGHFEDIC
ncbi:MAG: Gfo/Idh/MocA family oxidoreductase [Deltaproteobacteria bacterium]|nr:Gfo/Idh/MocA family oxidoreductase [Deltaproteobacteria bacterium]